MSQLKNSCTSPSVKKLIESSFSEMNLDDYGDYLTELMSRAGYRKAMHHLTSIVGSFEPYMVKNKKTEFEVISAAEIEVALVHYIKENLKICNKENKEI